MADLGPGELGDFSDLSRPGAFGGANGNGDGNSDGNGGDGGGSSIEEDRAAAIERLKRHAGPGGTLTAEDLADRIRRVYVAQTQVGIEQVLAELPAEPPFALIPGLPPAPGQVPAVRVRRGSPWRTAGFVLGAVVLLAGVGGAAIAFTPDGDSDDEESAADVPERELPASTLPPIAVPDAPASTAPPATTTTLVPPDPDLGALPTVEPAFVLQKVGQDIEPGRYLSTKELCYWERVKGFGGTLDDTIANGGSFSGHHAIVDVLASDAGLRSQGCDFRPYTPPAVPATTIGDGDWLVGSDVAAGTYRRITPSTEPLVDPASCAWERSTDFTFDYDGIIDYALPAGDRLTVELGAGERFTSLTCGTWTRV